MTGFLDWAPTKHLPSWPPSDRMKMSQWLDEQYTWMSLAIIVAFVWILYQFAYPEEQAKLAVAGAEAAEEEADAPVAEAGAEKKGPRRVEANGARRGPGAPSK